MIISSSLKFKKTNTNIMFNRYKTLIHNLIMSSFEGEYVTMHSQEENIEIILSSKQLQWIVSHLERQLSFAGLIDNQEHPLTKIYVELEYLSGSLGSTFLYTAYVIKAKKSFAAN